MNIRPVLTLVIYGTFREGSYIAILSLVIALRNLLYESVLILVEIQKCQKRFVSEAA